MKNTIKVFEIRSIAIIALVVVVGIFMIACDNGTTSRSGGTSSGDYDRNSGNSGGNNVSSGNDASGSDAVDGSDAGGVSGGNVESDNIEGSSAESDSVGSGNVNDDIDIDSPSDDVNDSSNEVKPDPVALEVKSSNQVSAYLGTPLNDLKDMLTVSLLYDGANPKALSKGEYDLSGTLALGINTITVTAQGCTDTFTVRVIDGGSSIGIPNVTLDVKSFSSITVYSDTPLDSLKNMLSVSLLYDNDLPQVLSQGEYTLSGTLALGTSTITVTSVQGYTGAFTVEVVEGSAVGSTVITVKPTHAQRGVIYPNTKLENLKNTLMLRLIYDDGIGGITEQMLSRSEYQLYGTLHVGTCNILCIASGFTFTFTIEISPPRQ